MPDPKSAYLKAPFHQGGIPTNDDLMNFLSAVRPEHQSRALMYQMAPNTLHNEIRNLLSDPEALQQARDLLGEGPVNAMILRGPYAMGDKDKASFGQPTARLREAKQ